MGGLRDSLKRAGEDICQKMRGGGQNAQADLQSSRIM